MKRLSLVVLAALLASCSSNQPLSSGTDNGVSVEAASIDEGTLNVPPLSSFKNTPARKLNGQYIAAAWSALPGINAQNAHNLWAGFVNNCRGLMRPVSGSLNVPARATPATWQPFCAAVAQQKFGDNDGAAILAFIQQYLRPWAVTGNGVSSNTVTGYYEPIVLGSKSQSGAYQWPMYAPPSNLLTIDLGSLYPELAGKRVRGKLVGNKVVPYDTRAQIAQSSDKPAVIAWLDDPVEALFLQIQGSGRVKLENGSMIRLAYADHNGRPYSSVGKWLIDQGQLTASQASMQNIKAWAKQHPDRVQEMLNVNQAMVFFKEESVDNPEIGPKGAYGIALIAQRAVAVDPNYVPLGSPIFLDTTVPSSQQALQRIVFAQDTGAAIKGPARVDFFWGAGEQAGSMAGRMKQNGRVWILWPKNAGEPSAR